MSLVNRAGFPWRLIFLVLQILSACGTAEPRYEDSTPWLTLTFDDGRASQRKLLQLTEQFNVTGTLYVVTSLIDTPGYLSQTDLLELALAGWEIGAHSATHPHLKKLSIQQLNQEIVTPKVWLEKLGLTVRSFATPWGEYDERILSMLQNHYLSNRNTEPGLNGSSGLSAPIDWLNIRVLPEEGLGNGVQIAQLKRLVDHAILARGWLVMGGHALDEEGNDSIDMSLLTELVIYALDQGVPIKSVQARISAPSGGLESH